MKRNGKGREKEGETVDKEGCRLGRHAVEARHKCHIYCPVTVCMGFAL